MEFDPSAFLVNLKYMGAGMLGIFLVIGIIVLSVMLLNRFTAPKDPKQKQDSHNK